MEIIVNNDNVATAFRKIGKIYNKFKSTNKFDGTFHPFGLARK